MNIILRLLVITLFTKFCCLQAMDDPFEKSLNRVRTYLVRNIQHGKVPHKIMSTCLDHEWDLRDEQGRTLVHHAVAAGKSWLIQPLAQRYKIDSVVPDYHGHTPLFYALTLPYATRAQTIRALIKHSNVDPNEVCEVKGYIDEQPCGKRAVHIAASFNDKKLLSYLLSQGADINAVDHNGNTPFDIAIRERSASMIYYLLSKADLNVLHKNNENKYAWSVLLGKRHTIGKGAKKTQYIIVDQTVAQFMQGIREKIVEAMHKRNNTDENDDLNHFDCDICFETHPFKEGNVANFECLHVLCHTCKNKLVLRNDPCHMCRRPLEVLELPVGYRVKRLNS